MTQLQAQRPAVLHPALRSIPTQPIPLIEVDLRAIPVLVANAPSVRGSVEALLTFHIDGSRTLTELAPLAGLTAREVLHVVAGMVTDGLVLMTARPSSIPAPSPRLIATPLPHQAFIDFADVLEEVELNAPGATTPTQHRAAPASQTRVTLPVSTPKVTTDGE